MSSHAMSDLDSLMETLGELNPFAEEEDNQLSQVPEPGPYEDPNGNGDNEDLNSQIEQFLSAGLPRWSAPQFQRRSDDVKMYALEFMGPIGKRGPISDFKELKANRLCSYSEDGIAPLMFASKKEAIDFAHAFHRQWLLQKPSAMDLAMLRTACVYGPLKSMSDLTTPDPTFVEAEREVSKKVLLDKAKKRAEAKEQRRIEQYLKPPIGAPAQNKKNKNRSRKRMHSPPPTPNSSEVEKEEEADVYIPKVQTIAQRHLCATINFSVVNRERNSPDYGKAHTSMIARSSESSFPTHGEDHNPWAERFPGGVFPIEEIKKFVNNLASGGIKPGMDHPLRQGMNAELFDEIAADPDMQKSSFQKTMHDYLDKMQAVNKNLDEEMADAN